MINFYPGLFFQMRFWFSIISCLFLTSYAFGAESESLPELKARADNGEAEAQFMLGIKYEKGEGVRQDYAEAVKWYQ